MKKFSIYFSLFSIIFGLTFSACKKDEQEEPIATIQKPLTIEFKNSEDSDCFITAIEIRYQDENGSLSHDNWTESIMTLAQVIPPSEMLEYELDLPLGQMCEYRLGILSDTNFISMLHDQKNWDQVTYPRIENTRDSTRKVSVTVSKNPYTHFIYISSFSDE